jgi:hypothetical protein
MRLAEFFAELEGLHCPNCKGALIEGRKLIEVKVRPCPRHEQFFADFFDWQREQQEREHSRGMLS